MPALLEALAASADPDAAFMQFDRFLSNLPAGVQLFSLFLARPELLQLVAKIAGSAPRLATHLARAPATFDALLDADFLSSLPTRDALAENLRDLMARADDYEGCLDAARRFAKEQIFRVGVQIIEGTAKPEDAARTLTHVAECVVSELLAVVEEDLAQSAGCVPGGRFAVIAMGKLGGREMTAASDLDLIFVYDAPDAQEQSNGVRPLLVVTYYARLAQRLIAALTVLTSEGGLYEVDMRLRPTGNKGPVAVSLESFRRYHESEAWTWERLALTRARAVAGDIELCREVEAAIRMTLTAKSDAEKIVTDARDMRERVATQFSGKSGWDLKYTPGGLVDIEFVVQTLQLCAAQANDYVLRTNTIEALKSLRDAKAILAEDAATIIEAANLQTALIHVLRIAVDGTLDPAHATAGLKALLARAGGVSGFVELERILFDLQKRARRIFEENLPRNE